MATKHKAPTQVTIASTEQESAFRDFVHRYWPHGVALVALLSSVQLFRVYRAERSQAGERSSWETFGQQVNLRQGALTPPSANVLSEVANELEDGPAAPWAKAVEIGRRLEDGDLSGARSAIEELETRWPDHPLASGAFYMEPNGTEPLTLRRHLEACDAANTAWEREHRHLFENPPLPADSPKVRITTSAGELVVGLYQEQAPEHVENFLKLCAEGFYDGTRFHRVIKDFMVQSGDPNSKDEDAKESWGQGGPGYTLEPEVGSLWHFPGAVAAAATRAGGPTSGSQFYIVTGDDRHDLDGSYTVFGTLLEGQATVDAIENGPVLGETPDDPVTILAVERL